MRIFFFAAFILFFTSKNAEANCNRTISSDTTQGSLDCADDQTMTVNEGVTWAGTVKKMIDVEDDDGFTLNNNGTIDGTNFNMLYFSKFIKIVIFI